jgi:hypothetical protein
MSRGEKVSPRASAGVSSCISARDGKTCDFLAVEVENGEIFSIEGGGEWRLTVLRDSRIEQGDLCLQNWPCGPEVLYVAIEKFACLNLSRNHNLD